MWNPGIHMYQGIPWCIMQSITHHPLHTQVSKPINGRECKYENISFPECGRFAHIIALIRIQQYPPVVWGEPARWDIHLVGVTISPLMMAWGSQPPAPDYRALIKSTSRLQQPQSSTPITAPIGPKTGIRRGGFR